MTVSELIEALGAMPGDADVAAFWDGGLNSNVEAVWLARSGTVALGQLDDPIYEDRDRPEHAPTGVRKTILVDSGWLDMSNTRWSDLALPTKMVFAWGAFVTVVCLGVAVTAVVEVLWHLL